MKPVDREAAARAIASFLDALGYERSSEELAATPDRVAEAFATELLSGERVDLAELVRSGSAPAPTTPQGLVLVRRIAVTAMCPHHLLPAVGHADVAYVPGERLLGLGTITRLVEACARRLTLQESIGVHVVDTLIEFARARGAYCRLQLLHTCLVSRGSDQTEARLITSYAAGSLAGGAAAADLALAFGSSAS